MRSARSKASKSTATMSTSDGTTELNAALGQVMDPGGGAVPPLEPAPLPGAMGNASPGASVSAAAPPVPFGEDPEAIARLAAQMASQLGFEVPASLAPISAQPAPSLTTASPGLAPMSAESTQLPGAITPASMPTAPTSAAPMPAAPMPHT